MTLQEISDGFDTMLNSFPNNGGSSLNLDEYEKSLLLTQAQDQLLIELYTGRNLKGSSFEETEELRSYLRTLIKTGYGEKITNGSFNKLSDDSQFFSIPDDVLFITYEKAIIGDSKKCTPKTIDITPVTQDEYSKVENNPFRGPNRRRVLRIDYSSEVVELISKYNIDEYLIKYIQRPTPIILCPLEGVSINGFNTPTECKLDSVLHMELIRKAVILAYSVAQKSTK